MRVLRQFSRLIEGVEALTDTLRTLVDVQRDTGPAGERLDALELSRHTFEAEIEAVLQRAEGKLNAASNSEARTRTMKKSYERFLDESDPEGKDEQEAVSPGYVDPGEEEGVQPLRLALASEDRKNNALRMKYR